MYAHFYHLTESPFNLTPDPKFHYVNEPTREAMAAILHGIKARKGFLTLIAEAGTGKTTLLKRIVDEIEGETKVVFVFNPGVSFDELLEFICMELGIDTGAGRRLHLLDRLNEYLLSQLTEGRNVIVMIDEAQTLQDDVLEELRLLSNLETAKEKILQILLCGQPELEEKLRRPSLRQLRQRIAVRATLRPVRGDEIGAYVETRLRSAGANRADFFTPGALRQVWQASNGIPRVVNVVCDNAMMIAFAEGKQRITPSVMREAVRDLNGQPRRIDVSGAVRDWVARPAARYAVAAMAGLALAVPLAMSMAGGVVGGLPLVGGAEAESAPAQNTTAPAVAVPPAVEVPRVVAAAERVPAPAPEVVERVAEVAVPPSEAVLADRRAVGQDVVAPPVPAPVAPRAIASRAVEPGPATAASRPPVRDLAAARPSPVEDSIRHARLAARATAARLYSRPQDPSIEEVAHRTIGEGPGALAEAADASLGGASARLEEVARAELRAGAAPLKRVEPLLVPADSGDPLRETTQAIALEADSGTSGQSPSRGVIARDPFANDAEASAHADLGRDSVSGRADRLHDTPTPKRSPQAEGGAAAGVGDAAGTEAEAGGRVARLLGPAADGLPLGKSVRILAGDTVWDIAVAHYGTAGPITLGAILESNPGIRDPRRLEVGAHIFLPFQTAEQMVEVDRDGRHRVLLAAAPLLDGLDAVRSWVGKVASEVELGTSTVHGVETEYQLFAIGLPSREAALTLAAQLLGEYSRTNAGGRGTV